MNQLLFACSLCDKEFESSDKYLDHIRNHRSERFTFRVKCGAKDCNTTIHYSNFEHLRSHVRRHHTTINRTPSTATYKCDFCEFKFNGVNDKNKFKIHYAHHLKDAEPRLDSIVCIFKNCQYEFSKYKSFHNHCRDHHCKIDEHDLKAKFVKLKRD
jgi:hypothetical protein